MQPSGRPLQRMLRAMGRFEAASVLAILGVAAASVGAGVMSAKADASLRTARADIDKLAQVAEAYQLLVRRPDVCPTLSQLEHSKLLRRGTHSRDPWGARYQVICEDDTVNVRSPGPDRQHGTPDDILRFPGQLALIQK